MSQILVVDDEVGIRELLSEILVDEGHQVRLAQNATEAREVRGRARPDLVLLDIWMPDTDGITLLKEWASNGQLTMPVVMMSGHGTIETAVEATRIGAYGFLEKPIAMQKLLVTVGKALAQGSPAKVIEAAPSLAMLGRSSEIATVRDRLERLRDVRASVLLEGEPGCGQELCARFLHRSNTPWVAPEGPKLIDESSGKGLAQAAEGTVYLRDVDELPRESQRALAAQLPALEKCNVRIIGTAKPGLAQRVADGSFDSKLYSSIASVTVSIPRLREHPDDIPEIANLMLSRFVETKEVAPRVFSTAALNAMRLHPWPGNLAQLESVVKTSALVAAGEEISVTDLSAALGKMEDAPAASLGGLPLDVELRVARDAFERAYFEYHLAREAGNMSKVAEKVGLERTHLYRKLKQLGLPLPRKDG